MTDDMLFGALNSVIIGYLLLIFLPKWRHTGAVVGGLAAAHSTLYALLLFARLRSPEPLPEGAGFASLDAVVALFTDRVAVLAGWTHYIAFDLLISRHIVMDAQRSGIPHLAVVWIVPLTLMAGPAGFAAYMGVKCVFHFLHSFSLMKLFYAGTSCLAGFMVIWVLFSPASWRIGFSDSHERFLRETVVPHAPVPASLLFKYDGQWLIQFSHILPSAVWAACIPIQLNPHLRKSYKRLHRASGYVFAVTALTMMIGYAAIVHRGLEYFHNDFPAIAPSESMTRFPSAFGWVSPSVLFNGVALWFTFTIVYAVVLARRKRISDHRAFIFRHVAAGLWIAPQRMYSLVTKAAGFGDTPREQKMNFGDGAIIGVCVMAVLGEIAVFHYRRLQAAAAQKKAT